PSRSAAQTALHRPAGLRQAPRRATPWRDRDDAVRAPRRRRCDNPGASDRQRDPNRRQTSDAARSGTPHAPARSHVFARPPGARSRFGSPSLPTTSRTPTPARGAGPRQPSPRRDQARRAQSPCRQQPLQLPTFPQLVDPPQGGDNLLAYRRPLTPTFDDLQIGAACRGLPAEIHTGEPRDDSIVVRTASPCTQLKSIEKCIDRGTTLSQPPPIAINNINDLDSATPCNCRSSARPHWFHAIKQGWKPP